MQPINTHVFQVAATIYESLLSHKDNKVPHDPSYAVEARRLAEMIYKAAKNDPIYSMAAARALCGFKKNDTSAHCTSDELVNLALHGASNLVEAFHSNAPLATTVPQHTFQVPVNNHPPPSMPEQLPQTVSPMGQPVTPPFVVPPPVTPEIPDFTTESSQR